MWKPGERQASPMSWTWPLPGAEGRAVRAPDEWTMLWLDRFRRWGRWRVVVVVVVVEVMSGEAGSVLTTILGAGPRDLRGEGRLDRARDKARVGGEREAAEKGQEEVDDDDNDEADDDKGRVEKVDEDDVREGRALGLCSGMMGAIGRRGR